jgi:hypothetical protein
MTRDELGDYCSIAGFIISLLTLGYAFFIEKRVRSFEKKVLFNTRVPVLLNNLKEYHSELSQGLGAKNERSIRKTLNLCKTVIEEINPKLPGDLNGRGVKILRTLTRQYKSDFQLKKEIIHKTNFWTTVSTLKDLDNTYDDINSFITKIDNLIKDKEIIP